MGDGRKPIGEVKGFGAIGLKIAIWPQDNGQCSFTISKRYKAKDSSEWKDTNTLFMSDLVALPLLVGQAAKIANDYSEKKYQEKKGNGGTTTFENMPNFDSEEIPF